jgi:exonuclease III
VRLIAWNIRAGGGVRAEAIAAWLAARRPDVVALSEFRATPPSRLLARRLAEAGLDHQRTTASPEAPARNALLVAARRPLRRLALRAAPDEPGRWLAVRLAGPAPVSVCALHAPNYVTGRKWPFLDAVVEVARRWRGGPVILAGDTNSGWPGLDGNAAAFHTHEGTFMDALAAAGWRDAFRYRHPRARVYSWYSPNAGNGFRLDQAFLGPRLLERLRGAAYRWATPEGRNLSDHAALEVDWG